MTITAKNIADSVSPHGIRLTTLQLRYPKFIHGEFMTHRVFSRNASSSRAIPVERLIKDVIDDPVYPMHWGKNQPGMQADEECSERLKTWEVNPPEGTSWSREEGWNRARQNALLMAKCFANAGYHKQIVNRLLEPFCHINVVVTATEWSNFFALRCHAGAQPEMRMLAEAVRGAMDESVPLKLKHGEWHLPYVGTLEEEGVKNRLDKIYNWDWAIKCSVARCARVSYLTQDGKLPNIDDDLKLYERLVGAVPLHASPAEHQATPDEAQYWPPTDDILYAKPELHGNFRGWIQYRKTLKGETQ